MNNQQIEQLADEALDLAVRHIQDALGVETGDLAGMVFANEIVRDLLAHYIDQELKARK